MTACATLSGVVFIQADAAAQTKDERADLITVAIEDLVRQRFALPGFPTLARRKPGAGALWVNVNLCSVGTHWMGFHRSDLLEHGVEVGERAGSADTGEGSLELQVGRPCPWASNVTVPGMPFTVPVKV